MLRPALRASLCVRALTTSGPALSSVPQLLHTAGLWQLFITRRGEGLPTSQRSP